MIESNDNVRYLLMDMTHPDYQTTITFLRQLQLEKDPNNTLTVIPNLANTRAVVKVRATPGWIQNHAAKIQAAKDSGLLIASRTYDELPTVKALLKSPAWFVKRSTLP